MALLAIPASIASNGRQGGPGLQRATGATNGAATNLPVGMPALPALPALPATAASAQPACQAASQLHVTPLGFKVALGTVVGTYGVETDGCALAVDHPDLLAVIDGGVPALDAVLRQPGVVDITFRNPNIQTPAPLPPVPSLPPLSVPQVTVPPVTVPNVPALQPVESAVNSVRNQVNSAVSSIEHLLSPTTTAPPPPPPPPPPVDTGPGQYPAGSTGFDISWPQCGGAYPPAAGVAVVGVNDGRPFTTNPCLQSEAQWAGGARELYMNLNSAAAVDGTDSDGPWGHCAANDVHCLAYTYGWNAADASYNAAASQGVHAKTWWLDVEVVGKCAPQFPTGGNGYWSCDKGINMATIQGALDLLRQRNLIAGIYSTSYQYDQIAGGTTPSGWGPPIWLAGASPSNPAGWCNGSHGFAGGPSWLLQFSPNPWDRDQGC